jgi:hypothetical protein
VTTPLIVISVMAAVKSTETDVVTLLTEVPPKDVLTTSLLVSVLLLDELEEVLFVVVAEVIVLVVLAV